MMMIIISYKLYKLSVVTAVSSVTTPVVRDSPGHTEHYLILSSEAIGFVFDPRLG
jgi:hypothetical protein